MSGSTRINNDHDLNVKIRILERKLHRERSSRKQAEEILEQRSLELYSVNKQLQAINEKLDQQVSERSRQLIQSKDEAEKTAAALWRSNRRLSFIMKASGAGIWDIDLLKKRYYCSQQFTDYLGYCEEDLDEKLLEEFELVFEQDRKLCKSIVRESIVKNQRFELEVRLVHRNGEARWFLLIGQGQRSSNGRVDRISGTITDIHDRINAHQFIEHMALHDELTKVSNRTYFNQRINNLFEQARDSGLEFSLMIIDINDFKVINDMYGHQAGDRLLTHIASRIRYQIKGKDLISRLGGDEFAILLPEVNGDDNTLKEICLRIIESCTKPINYNHHQLQAHISIGVSQFPKDAITIEDLIQTADLAMYRAKESKISGSSYYIYKSGLTNRRVHQNVLHSNLEKAIADEELTLFYQPQYNSQSNRLWGYEALIRWQKADGTIVPPMSFIPFAESCELILPIGRFVIEQACYQAAQWQKDGEAPGVSINISARQLAQHQLALLIQDACCRYEVPTSKIHVELTESAIIDDIDNVRRQMQELKEIGTPVFLDDFGTGYSSLSYLHNLPFGLIKIDRSFVTNVITSRQSQIITQTIINMAKGLEIDILAEGVETQEHVDWLQDHGCYLMQGYLFGRPAPAEDF